MFSAHIRISSTRAAKLHGGDVSKVDKEIVIWESDSTITLNHPSLNTSEQAECTAMISAWRRDNGEGL
ncbi:hypothetical protein Tco_0102512, partial [Tanacetum coccineum]